MVELWNIRIPSYTLKRAFSLGLVALSLNCGGSGPPEFTDADLVEVADSLRTLYYQRAYEQGVLAGVDWNDWAPDGVELRAWYAMNLARDGDVDGAVLVAEELVSRFPEEAWSWFALGGTLMRHPDRHDEALEPSETALELDPENIDVLSLRADVIRVEEGEESAMAFMEALSPEQSGHPLVLLRRAVALHRLSQEAVDADQEEEALGLFRRVSELDPLNVEAPYFAGSRLLSARRMDEALPLLRKAGEISPSHQVHQYLWRAIQGLPDLGPAEKLAEIEADIESMLSRGGETAGALLAVANVYGDLEEAEKSRAVQDQILEDHPETVAAEWVLVNRYRALGDELYEGKQETGEEDPETKAEYRRLLEEFVARPEHSRERLLGDAYRELLHILKDDPDVDADEGSTPTSSTGLLQWLWPITKLGFARLKSWPEMGSWRPRRRSTNRRREASTRRTGNTSRR
jgi:tetratricopeptide (TPR) repeat protein